jgi:hypothetical protein
LNIVEVGLGHQACLEDCVRETLYLLFHRMRYYYHASIDR